MTPTEAATIAVDPWKHPVTVLRDAQQTLLNAGFPTLAKNCKDTITLMKQVQTDARTKTDR